MRLPGLAVLALGLLLAGSVRADESPAAPSPAPKLVLDLSDDNPPAAPPKPALPEPEPNPPVEPGPEVKDKPPAEEAISSRPYVPELLGDQVPITTWIPLRAGPGPVGGPGQILVPSPRYFKIADNDSPEPRNRSYVSFNWFNDFAGQVNRQLGTGIRRTRVHREVFGWEWATPDHNSSFGIRVPLDTYNADHEIYGLNGNHTTFGDLALIFKEVVWRDDEAGHLISGGLAIVTPTGPGTFAGVQNIRGFHDTILQPFVGSIWRFGNFYAQGFTAVDAPCNLNNVVVLNNDLALGYFLYQKHRKEGVCAIVPVFEAHVNTPLNHRGLLRSDDLAGTADMVNLGGGINFEYADHHSLGVGFITPVSGPRMFDFEIVAQLRWRY